MSDLLPVSNKQMSNAYGGIGFCKEEAKTLHWDHGMNNGQQIKIPFLWPHKFPLGCDGHVSKFPIQSLYYPCYNFACFDMWNVKSRNFLTCKTCIAKACNCDFYQSLYHCSLRKNRRIFGLPRLYTTTQQHFIHSCTAYIYLNMEKRTKLMYYYWVTHNLSYMLHVNIDFIANHRLWIESQLTAFVIRHIDQPLKYRSFASSFDKVS